MAAGIAPDTAPANELDELVRAKVAGLRPKLLDLTRVNPLISAKLSPRSASLVRIVDELPDVVFYDITSGERLQIVPLPNLDTEPADERTREFTDRLANARLTDADYLAAIDALDDDAEDFPNRAQAIERTLKDRVRASLNLPARPAGDDVNLVQHARAHGISPSYDLPVPDDDEDKPAHHDDRLQTLFLPKDLERKLNAILSKCRTWQQETGLNVLHVAYGLLEWAEAAESTHSFAPLVLNEASLAREKTVRGAEFWIEGTGAEPETNTVLSEKLRLEFDIALPPFPGGSIEDYLEQIGSLAPKSMPVWRVRRQIVIGVFPSARMAMYRDLDPAGLRMGQDDVVSQLLAGHDTGEASPFAPEYEIDHPDIEKQVPRLISEADASQFSALVDIAGGRNLALEGPPGTGKSQTIVNAIAGAIGAGKKVLFVAEKLAALNVVKSRLEAAGLGEFLLPLQADRSAREQVIESIRERLDMEVEKPSRDHEAKVKEFRRVRDELAVYLKLMASEFQGSHLRVRDILGRTTAATQRLDALPREVVSACNISADVLSADGIDRIRRHAERLNEAHRHTLSAHPAWRSTKLTNPDRFTVEEICGQAATLGTRFRELATERALLQQAGLFADLSAEQLKDIASVLALVPGDAPKQALLAVLNPASSSVVRELHRRCTDVTEATQSLQPMFAVELDDSCLQAVQAIADACDGVPLDSVHDEDVQSEIDNQRKLVQFAQGLTDRLAAFVAQRPDSRGWMLRDFATAHGLVKAAGRAGLSLRKDRLSDHDPETIVILCDEIRRLRGEKVQLAKGLAVAGNLPAETLQDFAAALRTSGVLSIFSSVYRSARRLYKSFADRRFDAAEAAGELEKLASFQRQLASLDANPDARTIFGGRFRGLDTEFAPFEALGRFYIAVEDIGHAEVRKFLREASVAELESLPHLQIPPAVGELTFDLVAAAIPRSKSSIAALEQAATALRSHTHVLADPRSVGPDDLRDIASRLQSLMEQRQAADSHAATDLLGPMFAGAGTDLDLLSSLISWSDQALSHAQHLTPVIQRGLAEAARTRAETVQGLETTTARMLTALVELAKVDAGLLAGGTSHHETADRLLQAGNDPEGLYYCASSSVLADPLDQAGFRPLREHLAAHSGTLDDLAGACEALILRQLAKSVYEHHGPQLGTFVGSHLDSQRRLVASLDRELIALGRKDLRARVKDAARPPRGNGTGKKSTFTEMALIDNEISKSKRYAPVRDLTQRAGRALQELKPCWMMSPLAVAQYVPRNTIKFDLCIIDEASQMPPESALGALMRASQTVVVGDTNQLPPSNFFRTVVDDEDDDEDETVLNESILEMANATFRPPRRLRWHYRSRHSALIAFSNRLVYDDDLVVFPSADEGSKRMGVELREVPGLYKSGTNPVEAQALVDATMAFMRSDPDRSLGIVTLNQKQRELVREEFEARSASDTQVQDYLERWREQNDGLEEFFIKNLENVQGDERDVIFIGTVYGRETEGTRVMQRFGPINGLAGRRRLNVLFTRAKEKVVTFSSMTSADIVADENGNAGAYMLKRWLEYARTGVLEAGKATKREPDSEFEVYVINQIKAMGCEPVPQVGVAGYFIDIGIRHPQWPHGYLLGVECDGANYHSAKSARDRDRLHQEVLEGLGWRLHRIWSTDWFNNPHREAERLRQAIAQRLEQLKAKEQDYVRPDPAPNIAAAATPISALSARASERLSGSDEGPGRETTQVRGHRQPASDNRTSRDQPLTVAAARDMGVSIGDTVRVTYLAGGKQVSVRVTRDKSDASNGIIHCETPLAKALLGAEEGEEISVLIRNQVQRARVEEIIRPSLGR